MSEPTPKQLAQVVKDAVIEGRSADAEAVAAEIRAKFPAALAEFVRRLQVVSDARHDKLWARHAAESRERHRTRTTVDETYRGRRFVRIVNVDAEQRTVECFVELGTGLVWKAATWRKPAENYPRGCVFDLPDAYDLRAAMGY